MLKKISFKIAFLLVALLSACESSKIPTATATLSLIPETPQKRKDLTPEDLNTIPPEDVLDEVSFFSAGGGGGGVHCIQYKNPTIVIDEKVEYKKILGIALCHPPMEKIRLQISQPNKEIVFDQSGIPEVFDDGAYLEFDFDISIDLPLGIYTISVSSNNWNNVATFEVIEPLEAYLYYEKELGQLLLLGFQPNEFVRLFVYHRSGLGWGGDGRVSLTGWHEYQANSNGRLSIPIEQSAFDKVFGAESMIYYVAIGNISGESKMSLYNNTIPPSGGSFFSDMYCNGDKPLEIHKGDSIQVIREHFSIVPDMSDLTLINKDEIYKTERGPYCENGALWWYVECPKDGMYNCYIPETYYGEPVIQKVNATGEPSVCPNAQPTRLAVGKKAIVTSVIDTTLNMRGEPSMDKAVVHSLKRRDKVIVVKGPVCTDETLLWWYVKTMNGDHEGWVREGDEKDYWLAPSQ